MRVVPGAPGRNGRAAPKPQLPGRPVVNLLASWPPSPRAPGLAHLSGDLSAAAQAIGEAHHRRGRVGPGSGDRARVPGLIAVDVERELQLVAGSLVGDLGADAGTHHRRGRVGPGSGDRARVPGEWARLAVEDVVKIERVAGTLGGDLNAGARAIGEAHHRRGRVGRPTYSGHARDPVHLAVDELAVDVVVEIERVAGTLGGHLGAGAGGVAEAYQRRGRVGRVGFGDRLLEPAGVFDDVGRVEHQALIRALSDNVDAAGVFDHRG